VLHDSPEPARRAGRLQPLLARLLDKVPARRPSHDQVQALLVNAFPTRPPVFSVRGDPGARSSRPEAATSAPVALRPPGGSTYTLPSLRTPVNPAA
jgi:eukaryotic-like serine/threonine-protein kinase